MGNLVDHRSGQMVFKFATGCGDIIGIENGGNDADPLRTGSEHFVNVTEIDAADGEPGDSHICGCPADVIEGNRCGAWFCTGGINRADGDVIGARGDGFAGLIG